MPAYRDVPVAPRPRGRGPASSGPRRCCWPGGDDRDPARPSRGRRRSAIGINAFLRSGHRRAHRGATSGGPGDLGRPGAQETSAGPPRFGCDAGLSRTSLPRRSPGPPTVRALASPLERIARLGGTAARSRLGGIAPSGGDRCRGPTPATCASGRSRPARPARAQSESRGASGSANGRSRAGLSPRARRAAASPGRAAAARGRWAARPRRWPPWWRSGTTRRSPSTPTCWPSVPACGAAPRPCAGR